MVGLERTVVPLIGSETFHLASASIVTGFIVSFGVVKGLTNLVSGQCGSRVPFWRCLCHLGAGGARTMNHTEQGDMQWL